MFDSPIKISILNILKQVPGGLSEYELISQLQEEGDFFLESDRTDKLMLFQKHFLVMNALYQLQTWLLEEEGVYLFISPLLIKIKSGADHRDNTLPSDHSDTRIREYYLDWKKFEQTTCSDVKELLDGFWERYFANEKRAEALAILGLSEGVEWEVVQLTYRRLVAKHHPDKGGDQSLFVTIKEAHRILSDCYQPR